MIYTIYKITNNINNKVYIGFTQQALDKRLKQHINDANKSKGKRARVFYKAILKHGGENFSIESIFESKSFEDCLFMETHFINEYHSFIDDHLCNGYNTTTGGIQAKKTQELIDKWTEDVAKKPRSEEHKQRQSERMKGEGNHRYGKTYTMIISEEEKQRRSEQGKINGKIVTDKWKEKGFVRNPGLDDPETIKKMSETQKKKGQEGKLWIQSEEGRRNMSEKSLGKIQPESQKIKTSAKLAGTFLLRTPENKEIVIINLGKAGKHFGFSSPNILNHGKTKGFVLIDRDFELTKYPDIEVMNFCYS